MAENRTVAHTAVVLSGVSKRKLVLEEAFLLLVPSLTEGTLVSADLAFRARLGYLAAELRLATGPKLARIQQRLAFWLAREGGWSRDIGGMAAAEVEHFRETLQSCDLTQLDVTPDRWATSVRTVFAAAGAPESAEVPPEPELRLHIGGTGWHGFSFDPAQRLLEVPSPLAPPAGDVLRLLVDPGSGPGETFVAIATVVAVRRPAEAGPGAPAGFTLAVEEGAVEARAVLAARCPRPGDEENARVAPRYAVMGGARLTDPGEDLRYESADHFLQDYMTNLSHGGAFVRTQKPREVGERVDLHLRLPGRDPIAIPASVVRRTADGVGLQFEVSGDVEAALSATVASLAARPRRVLVVDDDALARKILSDAFAERGFEVLTAVDGDAGLRTIVDELLALDAVVTDVHMPGLSGDALISAVRQAGGEAELVLVAITADATAELHERLTAAGADAVLSKESGPELAVAEVEMAMKRHACPRRRGRAATSAEPPHAAAH
jgi:CheY-like chemotaxis protein/Tfp pilus assembly protein PilZ